MFSSPSLGRLRRHQETEGARSAQAYIVSPGLGIARRSPSASRIF